MSKYYIVVDEWNYPNESGHNIIDDFDTEKDAMECAFNSINFESVNFKNNCGDALPINEVKPFGKDEYRGYIITPKNCSDPYFYFVKVIEVNKFN